MAFKIGFTAEHTERKPEAPVASVQTCVVPKKSLVQVRFPGKGMSLSYYNDLFDLKPGDFVYVDGKLEGQLGRIVDVSYNFKIKIADYKRVIAVVNTSVSGQFHMAGSHFVTFERSTLPKEQISLWFKAPAKEDDEYVSSTDDSSFRLDDLNTMKITPAIAERGHEYYMENRVRYIVLDGSHGYAIVEGSESYTVEFEYHDGEISQLICECPCSYNCKHEFAAILQLRETLELIEKHYAEEYKRTGYGACPDGDEFLIQLSVVHHERRVYSAKRIIFEMSDDLWDIYMDKKDAVLGVNA